MHTTTIDSSAVKTQILRRLVTPDASSPRVIEFEVCVRSFWTHNAPTRAKWRPDSVIYSGYKMRKQADFMTTTTWNLTLRHICWHINSLKANRPSQDAFSHRKLKATGNMFLSRFTGKQNKRSARVRELTWKYEQAPKAVLADITKRIWKLRAKASVQADERSYHPGYGWHQRY